MKIMKIKKEHLAGIIFWVVALIIIIVVIFFPNILKGYIWK